MEKVKILQIEPIPNYCTICCDLKKVYPGTDGTPDKFAVKGAYLALPRGECFGILGPNGAGKTTFINMVRIIQYLFLQKVFLKLEKFNYHI